MPRPFLGCYKSSIYTRTINGGHMKAFMQDILKQKKVVQLWLLILFSVNIIFPLFLFDLWQAQLAFGSTLVSGSIMLYLHKKFGYTGIIGTAHFVWIPMLFVVMDKTVLVQLSEGQAVWVCAMISANFISLILDFRDLWKYVKEKSAESF